MQIVLLWIGSAGPKKEQEMGTWWVQENPKRSQSVSRETVVQVMACMFVSYFRWASKSCKNIRDSEFRIQIFIFIFYYNNYLPSPFTKKKYLPCPVICHQQWFNDFTNKKKNNNLMDFYLYYVRFALTP